ncbi:hypothetical protein PR048_013087 [Dryococelus australis]|uniref:Transposase n=1 Tax=Dryococelus australis TaxID=614101 RepID=A0ABQ9HR68_9NEOP|nr:hypothetical protein PR048_013087 [Dryococelus australis]
MVMKKSIFVHILQGSVRRVKGITAGGKINFGQWFAKTTNTIFQFWCTSFTFTSLFPVSNAKVERAFSTMKRVKTNFRNMLKTAT